MLPFTTEPHRLHLLLYNNIYTYLFFVHHLTVIYVMLILVLPDLWIIHLECLCLSEVSLPLANPRDNGHSN